MITSCTYTHILHVPHGGGGGGRGTSPQCLPSHTYTLWEDLQAKAGTLIILTEVHNNIILNELLSSVKMISVPALAWRSNNTLSGLEEMPWTERFL